MFTKITGGTWISLDGIDGCGKSTQCYALAAHLVGQGHKVVLTREPGGTPVGEKIRRILLDPTLKPCPRTELVLFTADRVEHAQLVLAPAWRAGKIVVSDRGFGSTLAYQMARHVLREECELMIEFAMRFCQQAVGKILTIILDLNPEVARTRMDESHQSRFDKMGADFQWEVRGGYLDFARTNDNVVVVDASGTVEQIQLLVLEAIERSGALTGLLEE